MPPDTSNVASAAHAAAPVKPRDAASLVLVRGRGRSLEVLLGRREPRSRFMPEMWVFPGGRVDAPDWSRPALTELARDTEISVAAHTTVDHGRALGVAAVRETFEETGLALGRMGDTGVLPDLAALRYLGRAITPTTSHVRFHARFFLARAGRARGRIRSNGELLDLRWFSIAEALRMPIIDVTEYMLEEVARIDRGGADRTRPDGRGHLFVRYRNERPMIRREG